MAFSAWMQPQSSDLNWKVPRQSSKPTSEEELLAQIASMYGGRGPAAEPTMKPAVKPLLDSQIKSTQQLSDELAPDQGKRQGVESGSNYKATSEQISNSINLLNPFQLERMQKAITGGNQTYSVPEVLDEKGNVTTPAREQTDTFEGNPAYLEQKRGNEVLQDIARANIGNIPNQLDLSPLMALTDAWSGSKLAGSYQKPMTTQERAKSGFDTLSEVQKRREALTAKMDELMKVQKAGYDTQKLSEIAQALNKAYTAPEKMGGKKPYYDPEKIEADTQKLQKNIGDQVPGIVSDLQELKGYMDRPEIPGIGTGMSLAPDFVLSKDGSRVRQLATDLYRKYVYLSSGKQINDTEAKDLMKIAGIRFDSKESSFRSGMKGLAKQMQDLVRQKEAAYRPEVITNWKDRGGLLHKDIPSIGEEKKPVRTPEQEARLKELLSRQGKQ